MPAQWTGEIIGELHVNGITAKQLSAQLGYNPKYVSAILNGKKNPKGAEEKFRQAVRELAEEKAG